MQGEGIGAAAQHGKHHQKTIQLRNIGQSFDGVGEFGRTARQTMAGQRFRRTCRVVRSDKRRDLGEQQHVPPVTMGRSRGTKHDVAQGLKVLRPLGAQDGDVRMPASEGRRPTICDAMGNDDLSLGRPGDVQWPLDVEAGPLVVNGVDSCAIDEYPALLVANKGIVLPAIPKPARNTDDFAGPVIMCFRCLARLPVICTGKMRGAGRDVPTGAPMCDMVK